MKLLQDGDQIPQIDFLPAHYREAYARRRLQAWRILIITAFAVSLPTASLYQYRMRLSVQNELQQIAQQHDQLQTDHERLRRLQTRLADVQATAELITFLNHPWPCTQVLASIVTQLPEAIRLEDLEVSRELAAETAFVLSRSEETSVELEKLPAPRQDLAQLRRENMGRTIVKLAGVTSASAPLHRYLAELAKHPLLESADLESIESDSAASSGSKRARFQALLFVRPGYGQPGGPVGTDAVQTDAARGAMIERQK